VAETVTTSAAVAQVIFWNVCEIVLTGVTVFSPSEKVKVMVQPEAVFSPETVHTPILVAVRTTLGVATNPVLLLENV
jgi:hypothetical protein